MSSTLVVHCVPYHDGLVGLGRARGPHALLGNGALVRQLDALGWRTAVREVAAPERGLPEADRVFTVARRLAEAVADSATMSAFPMVLAGDCNSCLGTVAGAGVHRLGVIWCDAHSDFDTIDDSESGSLDSMGLRLLTGSGWRTLRATIPDLSPVPERNVLHVGARDLSAIQRSALDASELAVLPGAAFTDRELAAALDDLRQRASEVYLHVDLDSLDTSVGVANAYAAPGGLSLARLRALVAAVFARFRVVAAAVTAYDPAYDLDGSILRAARTVVTDLAQHAWGQRSTPAASTR